MYPRELRRRFAEEMTDCFDQQLQGAWDETDSPHGSRLLDAIGELLLSSAGPDRPADRDLPSLSLIGNSRSSWS